ncbi:MAG: MBL fold metallo-hydrolase [Bacteroidetes bacterium]|nr:MBL fold metallo-hydrolase [Bacteroidota bacterium]
MKITQLNSASILIEDSTGSSKTKILCDPWLDGEEYIGSWEIYPPYEFKPEKFLDLDFIYVSHIHPDHCSSRTLSKLNKKIPILIHNFPEKFLKQKLEGLGFEVIELEHGVRTRLKNNFHVNILAADNCDPTICGNLMGCGLMEIKYKTTQIDTMAVFDNENQVVVNTNDCPYDIGKTAALAIKSTYGKIDFLLVGYVAASSWPHCYNLPENEKMDQANLKAKKKLETTKSYIELFEPRFYLPFAGRYTLSGRNSVLNQYRGEPELEDAFEWLSRNIPEKYRGMLLNNDSWFDLDTQVSSKEYTPINREDKKKYTETILSKKKFPYEYEKKLTSSEILDMIPKAYENFEKIRKEIQWNSKSMIALISKDANDDELVIVVSCNGDGFDKISMEKLREFENYMSVKLDIRLLNWLLLGPQKAHWGNADLGAHLKYDRVGSVYKRGLFYCWNHFHI